MFATKINTLSQAVKRAIIEQNKQRTNKRSWYGFADSKPPESIQKHELPGLSVAVLFPYKPGVGYLDVPGKQYKDCTKARQKLNNAQILTDWLYKQKEDDLQILGFSLTETQLSAAEYGLNLIEELPGVHVEKHYDAYRLFFSEHHIDFAQAVALEYYLFAAYFGMLRPSIAIRNHDIALTLFMDRFPGSSAGDIQPGHPIPTTDGMRFIHYVKEHSNTYSDIEADHKSHNVDINLTTLDWWTPPGTSQPLTGKKHPHFLLPDWLVTASIANEYRGEFIASFPSHKIGVQMADSCEKLHEAFKSFDIWSLGPQTLPHIVGGKPQWEVPQDAREFILNRAQR